MATSDDTGELPCAQRRKHSYRESIHAPPPSVANQLLFSAVAIAMKFAHRTPSVAALQMSYGMNRATAYRWIGAIKAAKGEC